MSDQLKPAIVRIFNRDEKIVGGGFLVSERHIITCAHVVNLSFKLGEWNTDKPDGEIALDFSHVSSGQKLKAEVVTWFPPDEESPNRSDKPLDIAVLELKEDPPAGCVAAQLIYGNHIANHDCAAFGFSKSDGRAVPVIARGEIGGRRIQIESRADTEYVLEPGFSGTALWDNQLNGVVGMVATRDIRPALRAKIEGAQFDSRAVIAIPQKQSGAFIIPTSVLVEAWPDLRNRVKAAINMAEPPPDDFVARPEEFNKLLEHLLDPERGRTVAIGATAALRDAGGYGKTTLARSVCHDPQIQSAFKDGILWVTIGETPGNLAAKLDDLTYQLSRKRPGSASIEAAITEFKKHLEGREILIVVDDVWAGEHLRPFLQGGQRCAHLITTRIQNVIPRDAHRVEVDAMRIGEAAELLAAGFEDDPDRPDLGDELRNLASTLGEWPLLLKLANGAMRNRVENGDSFRDALEFIKADLEENGLTTFYSVNEEERNRAVSATLGVSFRLLKESDLARFNELAVFPEDVDIPLDTIKKFWAATGKLSQVNAQKLLERLHSLSLLLDFNLKEKRIRLHDVIRKYLIEQQRARLPEIHDQLLDAHCPPVRSTGFSRNLPPEGGTTNWSEMPDDEPYLWDHLAFHLIGAGRGNELVETVKDWRYLAKKTWLKKSLSVEGDLVKAEKIAPADAPLRLLRRNFAISGHLFNRCETGKEVKETIYFRLQHLDELKTILWEMAQDLERPFVAPQSVLPDPPHPALIRTLEGHSDSVNGCAFSLDGKMIVSASLDSTLKVWDAETGEMLRTLEGHSDSVNGCAFSPDGRLILSASEDSTLKVWDAKTGDLIRTLEGHSKYIVTSCAFSPDGKQIISASGDRTLKVWDAESGKCVATFYADGPLYCCAFSNDNVLIVAGGERGIYFLRLER
jgi:hypothetical protein